MKILTKAEANTPYSPTNSVAHSGEFFVVRPVERFPNWGPENKYINTCHGFYEVVGSTPTRSAAEAILRLLTM